MHPLLCGREIRSLLLHCNKPRWVPLSRTRYSAKPSIFSSSPAKRFHLSNGFHTTQRDYMRLLECSDGTFKLTKDLVGKIPHYAILSHTWGPDAQEVTFNDLVDGTGGDKAGYEKIRFCAEQARRDGLQYFWVDTCCIDKSNHTELHEAINSMFRWYQNADRCYVYLSDISTSGCQENGHQSEPAWESTFRTSRWFTRGWTLQELLAPALVEFFARDGQRLGDKISLSQQIHEITGISLRALQGAPISQFSVEERLKWAEKRQTTREEDWAYCLLGIFSVFMPLIYGEGKENAIRRLRQEIDISGRQRELPLPEKAAGSFLVPYPENKTFIGRKSILEKLQQQPFMSTTQSRIALFGLGRYRKTQIALAYAYWVRKTQPEVSIFWVHASSAERFRQAFASIAQECHVPGYDDPKADTLSLVKAWLERKDHGRWLMIIDNADDTRLFFGQPEVFESPETPSQGRNLGRYVPECAHGSILVTTRNKQVASRLSKGESPVEVKRMDDHESEQLLRARLEESDTSAGELSALSSRLDHLPLVLVQAAAFMQENTMSVGEYLELLKGNDQDLVDLLSEEFETIGRDSETPRSVTQAWILSFEQIQQQNGLASELLSLMSLFDRQAIPLEFLFSYGDQQDNQERYGKMQLQKALGILKAFCFVTVTKDQNLDMHQLVQLVTRKWLANKGMDQRFAEQALLVVSDHYPFGNYENWAICARYLPHAYAVLNHEGIGSRDGKIARAALLHNTAGYFLYQGQWTEAEGLQEQAVLLRNAVLGSEHPDTLTSMANLASTYRNQGRWAEAESLEVQVVETRKRVLGSEHPDTLTIMADLASTYLNQGRWAEAESLEVQVMETSKRVLGLEHPDTLTIMANLASTFWNQGRWAEAESLEVQVMETRKRVLGSEHPDTLTIMANLASTYRNQGRWAKAELLFVQVMETSKRVLGSEHPSTLTIMTDLASTYRNQGRWAEAESLEAQVMETRKRVLGSEHPDTLTIMANLASTFWNQGRWAEAESLEVQVMETSKRVLGSEHPATLAIMANLASTFWNQGRWAEAESLEVQVMETSKRVLGSEHPSTLTIMADLASTYRNQGRWAEAESLEVQVMETRKRVLGWEHPDTLTIMANLAWTFWNQGRWAEAESLEVQVMETRKRVLGSEHPDTLTSMANLASTYRDQGRWKEAEELQDKELAICSKVLGEEHPDTLISMSNLALIWHGQARWREAVALMEHCLQLRERILGPEHPCTISTRLVLDMWKATSNGALEK